MLSLLPNPAYANVHQIAAVHLKNVIKSSWCPPADKDVTPLPPNDRDAIKDTLVQYMCSPLPPALKPQIAESISIISEHDYPQKWGNLLPSLVSKFSDPASLSGVLSALNSILKRFRYVERNDDVYKDLKYTLELLQAPLLALATSLKANLATGGLEALKQARLVSRVFFSLNWLDLPEYFEDNVSSWMDVMKAFLSPPAGELDEDRPSDAEEVRAFQKLCESNT